MVINYVLVNPNRVVVALWNRVSLLCRVCWSDIEAGLADRRAWVEP